MMNISMMFPFTMVCDSCKEYNYTGGDDEIWGEDHKMVVSTVSFVASDCGERMNPSHWQLQG